MERRNSTSTMLKVEIPIKIKTLKFKIESFLFREQKQTNMHENPRTKNGILT